ncbi:MAG: ECF-type sigma factor [Blastocatellia bacterium]
MTLAKKWEVSILSLSQDNTSLTLLLHRASRGDREAVNDLITAIYPELRRIAASRLRGEQPNHTLQPTELVNEVYLRLFGNANIEWQNRAHFFAIAAKHMRFILVEHARGKGHGGKPHFTVTLDGESGPDALGLAVQTDEDFIALDEAMRKFETIDARAALGVELRFFGGLTQNEIAEVQKIDVATVKRDWTFAKSWLYSRLRSGAQE